jgi:hypothetical protein
MWMYPGPSYLDHPFSIELDDTEINSRMRGVFAHGADLNFGSGPVPLREGVDSPWVSPLGLAFGYLCQSLFLNVRVFLRRILGTLVAPHRGSPCRRTWQGGRPTVSITSGCGHGGIGYRTGVPPGQQQGHGGRTLPLNLNLQEGTTKRRMKMERRGK